MKTSTNGASKYVYTPATRAQKIWGVIALVGLFACGLMIGLSIRGNNRGTASTDQAVQFTDKQCDKIAKDIDWHIEHERYDKLAELQKIYAESCGNYIPTKAKPVVTEPEQKLTTCQKIENLLKRDLNSSDDRNPESHSWNAITYEKLSKYGCPENADTYKQLLEQENAIANALAQGVQNTSNDTRTCEEIEKVLTEKIEPNYNNHNRLHNAEIYGMLAERGCPENTEKYKELALRQIDVVSAVSDDNELIQNKEEIADVYEKLQMQDAARNFLKKIDKLINPATDFIFEIEKVINE